MNDEIIQHLFSMQDTDYRVFQCRLMPTVSPDTVIGVRTPALRAYARELSGTPAATAFLKALPHAYYEENNLHAFLIERLHDYTQTIEALEAFLPFVDNWATCDMLRPKVFSKHLPAVHEKALEWMRSPLCFTARFGIETLMGFFLDATFDPADAAAVAAVPADEYYVHMMVAWYFATALAKQYDAVLPFIEQRVLDPRTHNKAIQKAVESYRITPEQKAFLRTLKISSPSQK